MRITVIPNLTRLNAKDITFDIFEKLNELQVEYCLSTDMQEHFGGTQAIFLPLEEAISTCDIVIAVGGDGTIIHAAKQASKAEKPILGVNAGRLAFMAGLECNELHLLSCLIDRKYKVDRRILLGVEIVENGKTVASDFCINDIFVTGPAKPSMSEIAVSLDGRLISRYHCDGILASTPTGSTAYSLSAGGPVVDPELECILMTPICPHSLFDRSLVFKDNAVLKAESAVGKTLSVVLDGEESFELKPGMSAIIKKSDYTADFIRIKADNFIDIVRNKISMSK